MFMNSMVGAIASSVAALASSVLTVNSHPKNASMPWRLMPKPPGKEKLFRLNGDDWTTLCTLSGTSTVLVCDEQWGRCSMLTVFDDAVKLEAGSIGDAVEFRVDGQKLQAKAREADGFVLCLDLVLKV